MSRRRGLRAGHDRRRHGVGHDQRGRGVRASVSRRQRRRSQRSASRSWSMARSIGSDVSTTCAKVPKGATGVDVLQAGGHTIGFRNDGLVCTIDGLPKSGCAGVDDTHYWAYFHRAPGATKWIYSSEGPATYQPANDSTEGWVYDNGKALTPENVPYDQICKTKRQAVTHADAVRHPDTPPAPKSAVATSPSVTSHRHATPTPNAPKSKTAATSHRAEAAPCKRAKPPVTGASSTPASWPARCRRRSQPRLARPLDRARCRSRR